MNIYYTIPKLVELNETTCVKHLAHSRTAILGVTPLPLELWFLCSRLDWNSGKHIP